MSHEPDWNLGVETVLVRNNLGESTKGAHAPAPLATPIYTSSTFVLSSCEQGKELSNSHAEANICMITPVERNITLTISCFQGGYLYSRWGNPTADSACAVLARLEGAAGSMLFSSGCGAINTALFSFLKAGDHLVCVQGVGRGNCLTCDV